VKVVIEVEITEEDQKAARTALYGLDSDPPVSPEDMVEFILKPTVRAKLHRMRSAQRFKNHNVYDALPETDVGRTMTEVTDGEGNKHRVMLPNGRKWKPQVDIPIEGSWECEGSPTKLCWYDARRDPAWDHCLFCGDPDERK